MTVVMFGITCPECESVIEVPVTVDIEIHDNGVGGQSVSPTADVDPQPLWDHALTCYGPKVDEE